MADMNRNIFGSVLVLCGFFLSINEKLSTLPRFAGIVLALIGALLLVLGNRRKKGAAPKK